MVDMQVVAKFDEVISLIERAIKARKIPTRLIDYMELLEREHADDLMHMWPRAEVIRETVAGLRQHREEERKRRQIRNAIAAFQPLAQHMTSNQRAAFKVLTRHAFMGSLSSNTVAHIEGLREMVKRERRSR